MKHTDGPWKVYRYNRGERTIGQAGSGSRIAEMVDGWPEMDTEANARLMAAAPRMFDALSAIAGMREGNAKEIAALAASVAAITLAEIANGA